MFGRDRLDGIDRDVDDACMEPSIVADSEPAGGRGGQRRRWRRVEEKRRIEEERLSPGASVAQVARRHGVNANQVFQWRRRFQAGDLALPDGDGLKLLPVIVADPAEGAPEEAAAEGRGGSIHVEFPGRALVTIEAGVEPALAAAVIERLAR